MKRARERGRPEAGSLILSHTQLFRPERAFSTQIGAESRPLLPEARGFGGMLARKLLSLKAIAPLTRARAGT